MITELDRYEGVPQHLFDSLRAYVAYGHPTGSFLRAVLENDLIEAFGRADPESRYYLHRIASLVYNHLPARTFGCWGSPAAVDEWIAHFAQTDKATDEEAD